MAQNTATKATATATKATAPAPVVATNAPLYTLGPWPVKAQGGNTIRAYAYAIAKALAKAQPQGFTLAQYKSALVANAAGSTMHQPSGGWVGHNMPTWAAHPKQGWLMPAAKA